MTPLADLRRITLTDGQPQSLPTDAGTSVRVRALHAADRTTGRAGGGEHLLALEVSPEPKLRLLRAAEVKVTKAVDDRGQALEQTVPDVGPDGFFGRIEPLPPAAAAGARVARLGADFALEQAGFALGYASSASARVAAVRLKKGAEASQTLRELSGTVTVQLLQDPRPQLVVEDVFNAAGKSVPAADGGSLRVVSVTQAANGVTQVRVAIEPPEGGGRPDRAAPRSGRAVLTTADGAPEYELALVDDKGIALPASGVATVTVAGGPPEFVLTVPRRDGPAKLTCSVSTSVTVEIPFTLRDVPLPGPAQEAVPPAPGRSP